MRFQGKVFNWNDDKGFGFIEPNGGGERAFVHIKAFTPRSRRPVDGDVITYELVRESHNRCKAENIQFARDLKGASTRQASIKRANPQKANKHRANKRRTNNNTTVNVFLVLFSIALAVSILMGALPVLIGGVYLVMSLIAFIAYALDKSAAKNGRWRTKESTLHLFAFLGGWPGALLAQNRLRHKSSKAEFKNVFWFTVLLNLGGLYWLHTEDGAVFLNDKVLPFVSGVQSMVMGFF